MEARLHPDVRDYLEEVEDSDTDRCENSLKRLADEPYRSRPKCDIKKLKGNDKEIYRLRVRDHRFEYFVEDDKVWIVEAFKRGRGYKQFRIKRLCATPRFFCFESSIKNLANDSLSGVSPASNPE